MSITEKSHIFRRALKCAVLFGVGLFVPLAAVWWGLRDELITKALKIVETQLSEKGLHISQSSLQVSWGGGIMLREFSVFKDATKRQRVASMEHIAFRVPIGALFGREGKTRVSAQGSDLAMESSAGPLRLEDLKFVFKLSKGALEIDRFSARLNGLQITAEGGIRLKKGDGGGGLELPDLAPWVKAASWIDFPQGQPVLALQVRPRVTPESGIDVEAELKGKDFRWKTLPIDRAEIRFGLGEGSIEILEAAIECHDGRLSGELTVDYRNNRIEIAELKSSVNPLKFLASLPLPESVLKTFQPIRVLGKVDITGEKIVLDLKDLAHSTGTFVVDAQEGIAVNSKSGEFTIRGLWTEAVLAKAGLEPKPSASLGLKSRWKEVLIDSPAGALRAQDIDLQLNAADGTVQLGHFESRLNGLRITASGTLPVRGGGRSEKTELPDLAPIINAASWIEFDGNVPTLALQLSPKESRKGGLDVEGNFSGTKFRWKGLEVEEAGIKIALGDDVVRFPSVTIDSCGGRLSGSLDVEYRDKLITISKLNSSVEPFSFIASLPLNEAVRRSVKPFRSVGTTTISGDQIKVDLDDLTRSTVAVNITSPEGIARHSEGATMIVRGLNADASLADAKLQVDARQFSLFEGRGTGSYQMPLAPPFQYQAHMEASGVSLNEFGAALGTKSGLSGTMDLTMTAGGGSSLKSQYGNGSVRVTKGTFYAVPFFGSLRSFLTLRSSTFGADVAEDLEATLTLKEGVVRSPDLRVSSNSTVVHAEGKVDLVEKSLDANVRANVSGLVGAATRLVSEILEVHGEGPLDDVKWSMKNVSGQGTKAAAKATEGVVGGVKAVNELGEKLRPGILIPKKK